MPLALAAPPPPAPLFAAPSPALRVSVVVPALPDANALPDLLGALAEQVESHGRPLQPGVLEVLVLAPGRSAEAQQTVRRALQRFPRLRVLPSFDPVPIPLIHDTLARIAAERTRPDGLVLIATPEARPAPDWVAREWALHQRGVRRGTALDRAAQPREALPALPARLAA